MDIQDLVQENKLQVILAIAGVVVLGFGLLQKWQGSQGSELEIVSAEEQQVDGVGTVVDVAGAVEKPGVYRLEVDARVVDALVAAGGLSAMADRDWISRHINQAEVVKDGSKIFIPQIEQGQGVSTNLDDGGGSAVAGTQVVNVNVASTAELDSLWGIGESRAEAIVSNRPYGSVEELKEKAGIPQNVIDANKDKITVY